MGLGFNVADEFVDMLFNYDRRGFWLSRIKKVLKNWEKKGLKWVNNDLKRVQNLDLPISSKEMNLKPWGNELITVLNLFNRANDKDGLRLSESRLKVLGYDKITKRNIKTAMLNSDKDTMANFCKTLLELSLIEDNKK